MRIRLFQKLSRLLNFFNKKGGDMSNQQNQAQEKQEVTIELTHAQASALRGFFARAVPLHFVGFGRTKQEADDIVSGLAVVADALKGKP